MKKGLSVYEIWFCEEFIHEFINFNHNGDVWFWPF